jgi:hypothetical protein
VLLIGLAQQLGGRGPERRRQNEHGWDGLLAYFKAAAG